MAKRKSKTPATKAVLSCGNCDGHLVAEHDADGLTLICPACVVRVAGPFVEADKIPEYKRADAK